MRISRRRLARFLIILGILVASGITSRLALREISSLLRRHGQGPVGIVIHHTATPPTLNGVPVTVATIDAMHARRGFAVTDTDGKIYHIGYHYLILQDGTVLPGRPEHLPGAHTRGYPDTLGIALVGDFQWSSNLGRHGPLTPPPAQLRAAEALTVTLLRKYHLTPATVHLHRDLALTLCPGDGFPRASFMRDIATRWQQRP